MSNNNSNNNSARYTDFPSPFVSWYSTILLALLYWLSILDRTIISLLVDPIKNDLQISDVQFGMLHGLAFAVTFSIFGLVAGALADRFSRRFIIFVSVTFWSLSTAVCGLAQNFWHLLLARIGVGAGEAGLNPCATSIITDLFPKSRLTLALAVYSLGASVGAGCAYLFGGVLIDLVTQSDAVTWPLIGQISPWQTVFIVIGFPGVLIAWLSFTMPEPTRRGVRQVESSATSSISLMGRYADLFRFMQQRKRFFMYHYAGFGLASICFSGNQAWYAAHMSRTFGWTATEIGLTLGITLMLGGMLGKFACGICVEALYKKGYLDAQFRWYGGCLLVAIPAGVIAMTTDHPTTFLLGMGVFVFLLSPLVAVYISALNLVTPNELRGTGVAFYATTVGLIALSGGPIIIAAFSDYVFGGNAIGQGMALLMAISCPLAAICLFRGTRSMQEAVAAAKSWSQDDE